VKHSAPSAPDFGIYVHWPYCTSKCPYCDFNSHVSAHIDHRAWSAAYLREIDRLAAETAGRRVDSVFFGGGTPSLMNPDIVGNVLGAIQRHWQVADDWEVTLEANPGSVEAGRFAAYRAAGVNRVSLGVQSLDDRHLIRLGRRHTADEARAALAIARDIFPRVSFDLIYARQDQTVADWRSELGAALQMAADHLSLYQLTIEDGTAFGDRHRRGKLRGLPDEDRAADLYLLTQDLCEAAGLPAYEVSNHARPDAESRHNLLYWSAADFAGIGPGAHGRLTLQGTRQATEALRDPAAWLQRVKDGVTVETRTALTDAEQAREYLVMGMRVTQGIALVRMTALAGRAPVAGALDHLADIGLVTVSDGRLRTSLPGRMVLNTLVAELAAAWRV
jgi:oxygen-independent coproporphyrinogen-3 oxidase